jgi:hypothetical protein
MSGVSKGQFVQDKFVGEDSGNVIIEAVPHAAWAAPGNHENLSSQGGVSRSGLRPSRVPEGEDRGTQLFSKQFLMPPGRHPETMKIHASQVEDQDRDSVRVSDVGADALIGPFGERALVRLSAGAV